MAYMRTVKTASGAIAVQIVWSSRRGSRSIEHFGSAHDDAQLEALKAAAAERLAEGQQVLDLGLRATGVTAGPWRSSVLAPAICGAPYAGPTRRWGSIFDHVLDGDEVLRDLVLARIIEPTSKADAVRVLAETGIESTSYRTVKRRLPEIAKPAVHQALSAACAAHAGLGPASLVLYDVSTLYFETGIGDGFREPGFSKERRLEPQITLGLLTDATGFPLTMQAFQGNKAETATILPVINAFKTAHQLTDVTVVADAGMVSEPTRPRSRPRVCRSSSAPGSPICPMWSENGATSIRANRSPMGWCSLNRGRPPRQRRPAASPTGSSTTSTATTGPGARCAASTTRSPKPNAPSTVMPRSNATATSGSPGRPRASTVSWRPRPARWPGGRVMPTLGLCRPAACRAWWGSWRGWIHRHNHGLVV